MFICCAWVFAACGKDSNVEQGQPAPSSKEVTKEIREAYDVVKAYAMTKKEELRQQVEKTLEFYRKQIDELKLKAEKAKGEARKRLNDSVEEWNKKINGTEGVVNLPIGQVKSGTLVNIVGQGFL